MVPLVVPLVLYYRSEGLVGPVTPLPCALPSLSPTSNIHPMVSSSLINSTVINNSTVNSTVTSTVTSTVNSTVNSTVTSTVTSTVNSAVTGVGLVTPPYFALAIVIALLRLSPTSEHASDGVKFVNELPSIVPMAV